MQWDDSLSGGFSKSAMTWLLMNPNYKTINVAKDKQHPRSVYNYYKELLALRKQEPALHAGEWRLLSTAQSDVFIYERSWDGVRFVTVANMSGVPRDVTLDIDDAVTIMSNYNRRYYTGKIKLLPYEAAILKRR